MSFIATLKEDYLVNIMNDKSIFLKKGERFKLVDQTELFFLLDLGGETPVAIRKPLIEKSGTGVEWYSNSFYSVQRDKKSWKKKFRMHIVDQSEPFTYEINMRLLYSNWEFTEVNQYTNGTDAKKIGLVDDPNIKIMLYGLLNEDEKFKVMMNYTEKLLDMIFKIQNGFFEIESIKWKQPLYRELDVSVTAFLKNEPDFRFFFDYRPVTNDISYLNLSTPYTSFNLREFSTDDVKNKILIHPEFKNIKLR